MTKKKTGTTPEVPKEPAKKGRPAGSPNRDYDQADAAPTQCRRCLSTERSEYSGRNEQRLNLTHFDPKTGREFNVIEFRACQCLKCGQWRKDRFLIMRQPGEDGI